MPCDPEFGREAVPTTVAPLRTTADLTEPVLRSRVRGVEEGNVAHRNQGWEVDATLAMAALFAAGAVAGLPTLLLDPWPEVWRPGIAANSMAAVVIAALLVTFRTRVTPQVRHACLIVGIPSVAAALVFGGGGAATGLYAMLFLWIGVYVAALLGPGTAVAYMAYAMACGTSALAFVCTPAAALTIGLTTLITTVVASVVVGVLTAQVRELANCDPLTGVANRRALDAHLTRLDERRKHDSVAIVILDLDGFKQVNDQHGHAAGDELLIEVTQAWTHLLRTDDLLVRIGGDEFAAILSGCDEFLARTITRRLAAATPPQVTVSVGYVCCDPDRPLAEQVVLADQAAYNSKSRGGACITAARA